MKKSTIISIVLFAVFAALGWLYFDTNYMGISFLVVSAIFATTALITAIKNRNGASNDE